jgi:transglutaminase-like putative cysteine protease
VDDDGLPVRETTAGGFRVERTAFEIAYENFRRQGRRAPGPEPAAPGNLARRTALSAGAAPPTDPIPRLAVRLGGQPLEGLDLDGGRQRLTGDTLFIEREGAEALAAGYRLPLGRRELAPYVRSAPLIQSDDARIQAQARQIIGRARAAERAADRLVQWVFQNVRAERATSAPSALDVLATQRGDCNEHTVLFVALARAVGLPARPVIGLVYLNGTFYYHAWPEVYLGDWVAVDPTWGQFPADAAHIRVAVGALSRQLELARLIGRLTLEVLPADPDR